MPPRMFSVKDAMGLRSWRYADGTANLRAVVAANSSIVDGVASALKPRRTRISPYPAAATARAHRISKATFQRFMSISPVPSRPAPNSWLCRRLRAEDALEALAVLIEDHYPQYTGHQSRRNARRRKRQVKRKDVVELRRQHCQRKWHEVAGQQQQSAKNLQSEKESRKVRCGDGTKELHCQRIRRGRLVDEVEKAIQPKNRKGQAQQVASDN